MSNSSLTYTVNKPLDQTQLLFENAVQQEDLYSQNGYRNPIKIKQNRSGNFYLKTSLFHIHYKMVMASDPNDDTEIKLKPAMTTFYKVNALLGYIISLIVAFFIIPLTVGNPIISFDILVVVMFPIVIVANLVYGKMQTYKNVDAFMKEYINKNI